MLGPKYVREKLEALANAYPGYAMSGEIRKIAKEFCPDEPKEMTAEEALEILEQNPWIMISHVRDITLGILTPPIRAALAAPTLTKVMVFNAIAKVNGTGLCGWNWTKALMDELVNAKLPDGAVEMHGTIMYPRGAERKEVDEGEIGKLADEYVLENSAHRNETRYLFMSAIRKGMSLVAKPVEENRR